MINEKDGADEGWLVVRVRLGGRQEGRGEEGTWDPSLLIGHWITAVVKLHSAKNWNKRSKISSFGTMRYMPAPKKFSSCPIFNAQHWSTKEATIKNLNQDCSLDICNMRIHMNCDLWCVTRFKLSAWHSVLTCVCLLKKFLMRQHWTYLLWNSEYEFTRCKREWHGIGL